MKKRVGLGLLLLAVVGIAAVGTNRTPLLRAFLQSNLDGNNLSITNAASVQSAAFYGDGSTLTNLPIGITAEDATNISAYQSFLSTNGMVNGNVQTNIAAASVTNAGNLIYSNAVDVDLAGTALNATNGLVAANLWDPLGSAQNSTNSTRLAANLAGSFDALGASQNSTNTTRLAANLAGTFDPLGSAQNSTNTTRLAINLNGFFDPPNAALNATNGLASANLWDANGAAQNATNTARLAVNLSGSFDALNAAQNATNTTRLAVNLGSTFDPLGAASDATNGLVAAGLWDASGAAQNATNTSRLAINLASTFDPLNAAQNATNTARLATQLAGTFDPLNAAQTATNALMGAQNNWGGSNYFPNISGNGFNLTNVPFYIYSNYTANPNGYVVAGGLGFAPVYGMTSYWSKVTVAGQGDVWIHYNGIDTNQVITTNGGTFTGTILDNSVTSEAPASNQLVKASWVRGLFNVGAPYYATTNIDILATNVGTGQTVYQFNSTIPISFSRGYTTADFLTNNGYIGSVITSNTFPELSGQVVVNAYLGYVGGASTPTLSVHPELYYSYDRTNWYGDYSGGPESVVYGRTNLYQWLVDFPKTTSTNAAGFYVERRFKVDTVTGSGTRTAWFLGGTNVVSGVNDASHITMQSPSATAGNAYLANNQVFTGSNTFSGNLFAADAIPALAQPLGRPHAYITLNATNTTGWTAVRCSLATTNLDLVGGTNSTLLKMTWDTTGSSMHETYAFGSSSNLSYQGKFPNVLVSFYMDANQVTNLNNISLTIANAAFSAYHQAVVAWQGNIKSGWNYVVLAPDNFTQTGGGVNISAVDRIRLAVNTPANAATLVLGSISFLPRLPKTRVAMTFDDGAIELGKAAAFLTAHGMRATFYVVPSLIGTAGYLSVSELKGLHDNGHLIGNHSWSHKYWHTDLADNSAAMLAEFRLAAIWLGQNGFGDGANICALPGGNDQYTPYNNINQLYPAVKQLRLTNRPDTGAGGTARETMVPYYADIIYGGAVDDYNNAVNLTSNAMLSSSCAVTLWHGNGGGTDRIADGTFYQYVTWVSGLVASNQVETITMSDLLLPYDSEYSAQNATNGLIAAQNNWTGSNYFSTLSGNGSSVTNLTLTFTTNAIAAQILAFGRAYMTNIAGNMTLGAFSGVDNNLYGTWVMWVTNSSANDYSVTCPNGVWGSPGAGTPPVYYCTNKMLTVLRAEHYGQLMTNVTKVDFAP